MVKNRYDSLQIIEQIYACVGCEEFTKHNLPPELRNHLSTLSINGYLKRIRRIKGEHNHNIPVYLIVSKYYPNSAMSCVSSMNTTN